MTETIGASNYAEIHNRMPVHCLFQWLDENHHQRKLQRVIPPICTNLNVDTRKAISHTNSDGVCTQDSCKIHHSLQSATKTREAPVGCCVPSKGPGTD